MMNNQETGWISVIIPVYNAYANLDRCLLSLQQQTYRKVEVVFVNDCSTDRSLVKIQNWKTLARVADFRVVIVSHAVNRGVAAARNTGLAHATGEYIYYLDADDYIEPDTLERMYGEVVAHEADIVGCEWFLSFSRNERRMSQPDAHTGVELFQKMCYGVARWNLWLFLVRRSLYTSQNIWFVEKQNMGEDMMVMMKLALHAGKVVVLHQSFYHYVQTNVNSLTKGWSDAYRNQVTSNVKELERYVNALRGAEFDTELACLKLNIKLPLLVSGRRTDYQIWLRWFPEADAFIGCNQEISWRTRALQYAATKHCFWLLKLYYWVVLKFVYGILYH